MTPSDSAPALRSAAIVGAGAVGGYFGATLAKSGVPVTIIGRPAQVEAIRRDGLVVRGDAGEWRARVEASPDASAAANADLVLVAVKSRHTGIVAEQLRPYLRPDARVVSLQNGVDNARRMAAALSNAVYAAVVYVGADTEGPGRVRHTGRGDLVLGLPRGLPLRGDAPSDLAAIARFFRGAGVPCDIAEDIDAALWSKLVLNCALNPVSALEQARYGAMMAHAPTRDLMERIVRETVRVAAGDGVTLDAAALIDALWKLAASMPQQQSSTAQDLQRGRPTEIDALNGFVAARADALGMDAPINRALHALVKAREVSPGPA